MYSKCLRAAVIAAVLFLTACSEAPKNSGDNKAGGPSTPVSGKTAFWEMYKSAHSWANDLVPLKLESKTIPGIKNDGGNAAMWSATFGSPRKHEVLVLTYAVAAHSPDIYKGVSVGHSMPWGGPTRDALPFQTADFQTDSDAAYKTASANADAWLKKNPGKDVSFQLGNAARFPAPVWYVLWGDTKTGHSVFVNAVTGKTVKPGK
jgi:hypothetical protein